MSATLKQKLAASKLVENGGNMSKTMIAAGYSPATAKTPQKLTKSKSWQKLMDKYLPEEELIKKHAQLLEAIKVDHFIFPYTMSDREIKGVIDKVPGYKLINIQRDSQSVTAYFSTPDAAIQANTVALGYKIYGKFKGNSGDGVNYSESQEIREVIFRIRQMLPAAGS